MKSRITIEVDFGNSNEPVIQIIQENSDDVRDKLVAHFTQQLGGSSWLNIKWDDVGLATFNRIIISPIRPENFRSQGVLMLEQAEVYEKWLKERSLGIYEGIKG